MKKIFFASVAAALAAVWVQTSVAADLRSEISKIESANGSWNDISADFEQKTFIALLGKSVAKKGLMHLKKGGKFRIEYKGDDPKVYLCDGSTIWIFVPGDASSLQTYAVGDKSIPKEALSFLSGFGAISKEFKVDESASFPKKKNGEIALALEPKKKSAHYRSLEALFSKDGIIREMIVHNESGNRSHYILASIKMNLNPPDDDFTLSSGKATPDTLPQ